MCQILGKNCTGDDCWQEAKHFRAFGLLITRGGEHQNFFPQLIHSLLVEHLNMNSTQSRLLNWALHDCSAICGIYQRGHSMAFSEAWQLRGIPAFAYPTDFSRCHTPLQFQRNAINCLCVGPGNTVVIVSCRQWQSSQKCLKRASHCSPIALYKMLKAGRGGKGEKRYAQSKYWRHCFFYSPTIQTSDSSRLHCSADVSLEDQKAFKQHIYKTSTISCQSITESQWSLEVQISWKRELGILSLVSTLTGFTLQKYRWLLPLAVWSNQFAQQPPLQLHKSQCGGLSSQQARCPPRPYSLLSKMGGPVLRQPALKGHTNDWSPHKARLSFGFETTSLKNITFSSVSSIWTKVFKMCEILCHPCFTFSV